MTKTTSSGQGRASSASCETNARAGAGAEKTPVRSAPQARTAPAARSPASPAPGPRSSSSLQSFSSSPSSGTRSPAGFIPKHGGYRRLLSYQKAEIIHDATLHFCDRFIDRRSRTHDQMVQAARSGKQNIVEGSQASGTSKETELKLTNVARASLEELLTDYLDFLRQHGLNVWPPEHAFAKRLRELNRLRDATYEDFRRGIEHPDPEIAANVIVGLIKVAGFLLDRQIVRLEQDFLCEGGLRERMTRARLLARAAEKTKRT